MRIGIIGCGGIGKYHASRIKEIPGVEITAVCDIIPERAEKLSGRTGAKPFTDYREMYDLIDVAWICTPPELHAQMSIDVMKAGKDVFCEKPMALSLADADRMIDTAAETGRRLAIGYCLRFSPWTQKCKEIVDSGVLGDITKIWCDRMSPMPNTPWLKSEASGGGMLTEQTTHNLDWMLHLAGDPASVFSYCQTVNEGVDIFDNVSAVIKFKNGAIGQVMASWSSVADWIESGIVGTKGVLRTGMLGQIKIKLNDSPEEVIAPEDKDMYFEEEKYFLSCIAEGRPYLFDLAEAKRALALSLAIHRSAREGKEITL